ncbi:MAG: heavy metal-responsive transcriptional regulator [Phycisphaerae bacterium]|nr:heavy metal-responsive transcriptional regulator [Phycisphaerae bacterium]
MRTQNAGQLTIGETAQSAGVATTTLRYYERKGLLSPTDRSRAGYRLYDNSAVERLEFIRAAQAVGFTLDDIRALLQLNGDSPCKQVQALIGRRMAEVDEKLADLRRVRATLADALERCRKSKKGCAVVADLKRKRGIRRSN